jgi:hypothetical protein
VERQAENGAVAMRPGVAALDVFFGPELIGATITAIEAQIRAVVLLVQRPHASKRCVWS